MVNLFIMMNCQRETCAGKRTGGVVFFGNMALKSVVLGLGKEVFFHSNMAELYVPLNIRPTRMISSRNCSWDSNYSRGDPCQLPCQLL